MQMTDEILTELRAIAATSTMIQARLAGNVVNDVLEAGTGVIGSDGTWSTDWRVAAGAVWVCNLAVPVPATTNTDVFAVASGAAGAAGAATLPAGAWYTGYDFFTQTPAAAVAFQTTVTGLAAPGTITYDQAQPIGGTGQETEVRPPFPLQPLNAAATVAFNVPAVVSGPAWSAVIYGQTRVPANAHTMTLAAGTGASPGGPPTIGKGVFPLFAGRCITVPIHAHGLTIYGVAGDQFEYAVFTSPARPASSAA